MMATESLDDLIDHLLDEVALCGESGKSKILIRCFIHFLHAVP